MSAPVVVGIIDRLGYLRCLDCAIADRVEGEPVHEGSHPHCDEQCDTCGAHLEARA